MIIQKNILTYRVLRIKNEVGKNTGKEVASFDSVEGDAIFKWILLTVSLNCLNGRL
jgi:hypothetical protein